MLLSLDKLKLEINKVLRNEYDNAELKRTLNESFLKKNLNVKTIPLLFEEKKFVEQLTDFELIAFSKGAYSYFRNNESLNPKKYFSEPMLNSYKNYISTVEEINVIKLKNFIKTTDFEYYGNISYEDLYKYMSNNLILYTLDIQRSPTFKKMGNSYIKTATIDTKSVKNIEATVLKGELETTQIVLTLLIDDNHMPRFDFKPKFDNIGDVVIDEPISLNDGMHRCLGICSATAKHLADKGEYIDGSISVRLIIADQTRARRVMQQSFLRSNTSVDFLKAITETDITLFLDKVINQSKMLKGNVANTYEEAKAMKKKTYKTIMIDLLHKTNINFNNKSEVLIKSKKMAEYIDTLNDLMVNSDLDINLYAMFIWFAYKISETKENIEMYYRIADKIDNMTDGEKKEFKLQNKTTKLNLLIKYFDELFEEEKQ